MVMRYLLVTMVAWLLLTGVCMGKQVYLQDGAVLECESFWRRGDKIMVKVNRDIILEFDKTEINDKRTFLETKKRAQHWQSKKLPGQTSTRVATKAAAMPVKTESATISPAPAAQPAVSQAPAPVANVATTAEVPAPAPNVATVAEVAVPVSVPPATQEAAPAGQVQMTPAASSSSDQAEMEQKKRLAEAMMAGGGTKILLFVAVFALLIIVSLWVVFEKAGQPGFHSIIPIYNLYVMMEISGKPWWWMFLLFVPVLGLIINLLAMLSLAEKFGRGFLYGLGLFFLPMFFFPMLAFGGARYEE